MLCSFQLCSAETANSLPGLGKIQSSEDVSPAQNPSVSSLEKSLPFLQNIYYRTSNSSIQNVTLIIRMINLL